MGKQYLIYILLAHSHININIQITRIKNVMCIYKNNSRIQDIIYNFTNLL